MDEGVGTIVATGWMTAVGVGIGAAELQDARIIPKAMARTDFLVDIISPQFL
jgi:hypothetical protein